MIYKNIICCSFKKDGYYISLEQSINENGELLGTGYFRLTYKHKYVSKASTNMQTKYEKALKEMLERNERNRRENNGNL